MIINIITTTRRNIMYLPQVQASIKASGFTGQVNLVDGDQDKEARVGMNILLNKCRALRFGEGPVLLLEDDVILSPNWQSLLETTLARLPQGDFVLDCCKNAPNSPSPQKFPRTSYGGTQAVYFSSLQLRLKIADYLEMNKSKGASDWLIGQYAMANNELYLANQPIATHIGFESTYHYRKKVEHG